MRPSYFITGIGTGVGKTLVSAILAEALEADYWKPIQAGFNEGMDSGLVHEWLSNPEGRIKKEVYRFQLPASPHIAAREEGSCVSLDLIKEAFDDHCRLTNRPIIIEGAGGLLVPLNESKTIMDLISKLGTNVIVVSRNYLGSINHSLLTANILKQAGINVSGWVFNDHFMDYEREISDWTQIPILGSIPFSANPDKDFILEQAELLRPVLKKLL